MLRHPRAADLVAVFDNRNGIHRIAQSCLDQYAKDLVTVFGIHVDNRK